MNKLSNPFVTIGYVGPKYFCNRKEESKTILGSILGGTPMTLTSIRRIGKTGLIRHVLNQLPREVVGIYLDIQAAENLNGFMNILATSLVRAAPERSRPGKIIWEFVKKLRPVITFEHLSGMPQVTLDIKTRKAEPDIETILRFLEKQPFRVVIAIDEFQQILSFPEKRVDAWLRGIMQQLTNITFIFAGSQQHLMSDLFSSPSRPFYRSTSFMQINKIPAGEYMEFIGRLFGTGNRKIKEEVIGQIMGWTDLNTYYTQLLCNRIYSSGENVITTKSWQMEALKLIRESEMVFFGYREMLTAPQWLLLKALASEKKVSSPTAREFLQKYNLSGSATVLQSLQALIKKELVYKDYYTEGKSYYSVYDLLFQHWIRNLGTL